MIFAEGNLGNLYILSRKIDVCRLENNTCFPLIKMIYFYSNFNCGYEATHSPNSHAPHFPRNKYCRLGRSRRCCSGRILFKLFWKKIIFIQVKARRYIWETYFPILASHQHYIRPYTGGRRLFPNIFIVLVFLLC